MLEQYDITFMKKYIFGGNDLSPCFVINKKIIKAYIKN